MAALFDRRQSFYLCNQRRGSTLRWDKLITLSLSHWSRIKGSSLNNPPSPTPAHFAVHYLHCTSVSTMQSVEPFSTAPPTSKRKKKSFLTCTALANPLKSPKWGEDENALCSDSDLVSDTFELSFWLLVFFSFFLCVCSPIKCQCNVIRLMTCGYCEAFEQN